MTTRKFARDGGGRAATGGAASTLVRRTRLMANAWVMLVRVETFRNGVLCATHLKLSAPDASRTFSDLHAAFKAYKLATRLLAGAAGLKRAA